MANRETPIRYRIVGTVVPALLALMFAAAASAVEPMHSANWFNPDRSGEGWSLEILNNETAVGYWFTYDEAGNQRWLIGVGNVAGDHIDFPEMLVASGGRFGPDFDPGDVVLETVGSVSMTFTDCNNGFFEFSLFGQEMSIELARLSRTLTLDCDGTNEDFPDARGQQSGSWFDPTHSGEGFSLQWQTNGTAVVTWFTYTPDGDPYWMLGVGEKSAGVLLFPDVIATRGARFGAEFDAGDLEVFPWGELRMSLGCATGTADYASLLPEFGSGSFQLTRLTVLRGLNCTGSPGPDPDPGVTQWRLIPAGGPALSEVSTATAGGFIYLGGGLISISQNTRQFWRYDPATESWTRMADLPAARDHGMATVLNGKIYYFGGFTFSPARSETSSAWRFDPATNSWTVLPNLPATRAAGGAAVIGEHIYIAGGARTTIDRYTPASNSWTTLATNDPVFRDHAAVVTHQGELWIMGGRSKIGGDNSSDVRIFNPQSGVMRPGPAMQIARSGFAAVSMGDVLVTAGGESLSGGTIGSAEVYSAQSGWGFLEPLPVAVHGLGGVALEDGRFYFMLGSTQAGGVTNPGLVQILEPASPQD